MKLTRREFAKLAALSLGVGASMVGGGLPPLTPGAQAAALPSIVLDPALPLHPLLQYGAQLNPKAVATVIVQATGPAVNMAAIAKAVNATIKESFPFISAYAMDIPQGNLVPLARTAGVRYVTPNAGLRHKGAVDPAALKTTYEQALGLPQVWNDATRGATGRGVTVAILDTGIAKDHPALAAGVTCIALDKAKLKLQDKHGHGTHVTGIIKGRDPQGRYVGVAPDATVVAYDVADKDQQSSLQYLLRGLQRVYTDRAAANIRVLNLSVGVAIPEHYATSPVCAAVEQLWFAGVTVVVAAGNRGSAADAVWYAPANDPYVITVGALDTADTVAVGDDRLASFSSRGLTQDGFAKPEIVAPGRRIVAPLSDEGSFLGKTFPERIVDSDYIRLSGTSMAAPIVAGVAALLLQRFPALTPDQLKWLLVGTARRYAGQADAAGVVDPVAAMRGAKGPLGVANRGIRAASSTALPLKITPGGNQPWDASYWDASYWDASYWDASYWDASYWDADTTID